MIVDLGNKVVTKVPLAGRTHVYPAGTVVQIIDVPRDPEHAYRVRATDGFEAQMRRSDFVLFRVVQEQGLSHDAAALQDYDLERSVIFRCVVGSRAYGLESEASDVDTRGIYLAPAAVHASLYGAPEQLENRGTDEVYWELQKFLTLALKANPNILEVLFTPLILEASPLAQDLLSMRQVFVTKLVYQTYDAYVLSQFKKMQSRRARGLAIKPKHAMHLIRLLLAGVEAMRSGRITVRVADEHRADLLRIRHDEMSFEELESWRLRLHRAFAESYAASTLPERPDYARVNDFLVRARREAWGTSP